MLETEKIEIADICVVLRKLAGAGVFPERTVAACSQAATLLMKFSEVVIGGAGTTVRSPDYRGIVEELMQLLVEQGEG